MAYLHDDLPSIIYKSRIRTAADAIKSISYDDDPAMIDSFIASVCEIADDYDRKFCAPRRTRGGWSNL
jgi:hypothetical protein